MIKKNKAAKKSAKKAKNDSSKSSSEPEARRIPDRRRTSRRNVRRPTSDSKGRPSFRMDAQSIASTRSAGSGPIRFRLCAALLSALEVFVFWSGQVNGYFTFASFVPPA